MEYTPQEVKVVGEPDYHGNLPYSVKFTDGSYGFMKAQNAPVVGTPEFGEIQDVQKRSGDGTYKKFVRKQRDNTQTSQTTQQQSTQQPKQKSSGYDAESAKWLNAMNNATQLVSLTPGSTLESNVQSVLTAAHNLYTGEAKPAEQPQEIPPDEPDDEVDLSEVPF